MADEKQNRKHLKWHNLLDGLIHCEPVAELHDYSFDKEPAIQTPSDVDTCHFAHKPNLVVRFPVIHRAVCLTDAFDDTSALCKTKSSHN